MNIHVRIGDREFNVEVGDISVRPIQVKVDHETIDVWPVEDASVVRNLTKEKPLSSSRAQPEVAPDLLAKNPNKINRVNAPIPGTIISIAVKPGDNIMPGQELCVIEAMKMKNVISSNRAGTIAAVLVNITEKVKKGQSLIEFND
ncbi:MAG TPA: biotin/lipoyl-containing protein [Anaerolineaceae bacterium]|nr:biotin/lipoyl-containing protein [Anaerolineaceae bacterium]